MSRRYSVLILTLILSLGSSGEAAPVKKKKKTVAELLAQVKEESRGGKTELRKSKTSLPDSQLSFQQAAKRNLEAIKPPPSSVLFQRESGLKGEYEKVLDQQIAELYKLTRQFKDSPNRGELWLRLAELYVEKAGIVDILKQEQYDRQLRAYQAGKIKNRPHLDLSAAREYNKKAIQLYEWFTRDFPGDSKNAQALFFLGYNYFEMNNPKKGVEYYDRLVKIYPRSPFVTEAYFALGEFYFENDKWADAYKSYTPLIKDKRHPLHTFALYKGAWALYRMGKYEQALSYLEHIIKAGKAAAEGELAGKKAVNRSRLESEATRDLVVFYAAVGEAQKAGSYFSSLVSSDNIPHLEKLATYYNERGNKDASSLILKNLIAKDPTGPKAYNYQYQIVQNYFYAKNSNRFRDELYTWVRDYNTESAWYKANSENKELIDNSQKLRETTLKKYALQQHQTAQNSRAPYARQQANEAYQLYLGTFGEGPGAADMRFYYGELLYDMDKYDAAATQYNWVVQNAPQNKFFNKAAVNLIHAVEKSVPDDRVLAKRVGTSTEKIPLDPKVEQFIKAGEWYTNNFPSSDKIAEIRFRMGRLYYQHNHFTEANEIFRGIVQKYPRSKPAEFSANIMLDIYSLMKDYVGLEQTGRALLEDPAISGSKAGEDIRGVLEKASFKKAQDLEIAQKYVESAQQFELFGKQNPKSKLLLQALFNAGVNYERAGMNYEALVNYQQVIEKRTESGGELKLKAKRLAAKLYQNSGQLEEAAKLFKQVADEDPKDALAPNLIFTAAAIYEVLGRNDEAVKSYSDFLKVSKKHLDRLEAVYSMGHIYRKAGQRGPAIQNFEEFIDGGPGDALKAMEAHYWLMELNGNTKASQEWRKRILSFYRNSGAKKKSLASYAAKARLKDAEENFNVFKAIRLSADPVQLKRALDTKLQYLKDLKKIISDVIDYDSGEEIVAGLAILGQSFQNMGDSFVQAPLPRGLTAEEQKIYKEKVEKELAEPQYREARESYRKAVEKAWSIEAFPDRYHVAYDYLRRSDPANYYDGGETVLDSRLVNWMLK